VEGHGLDVTGENRIAVLMNRLAELEAKGLNSTTIRDLDDAASNNEGGTRSRRIARIGGSSPVGRQRLFLF
jgi:hypothetical protein